MIKLTETCTPYSPSCETPTENKLVSVYDHVDVDAYVNWQALCNQLDGIATIVEQRFNHPVMGYGKIDGDVLDAWHRLVYDSSLRCIAEYTDTLAHNTPTMAAMRGYSFFAIMMQQASPRLWLAWKKIEESICKLQEGDTHE